MKILLSWLLDHIDYSLSNIDVAKIVHLFNIRTAEIESFERVSFPFTNMFVGSVTASDQAKVDFYCLELRETVALPSRSDVVVGKFYLAYKENQAWRWVLISDFCAEKDGIMPAVYVHESEVAGSWRLSMPALDYVLDVDNKSINHRPDLWGHYGIAREIAAFLDVPLKSLDSKIAHPRVVLYDTASNNIAADGLKITIENKNGCSRFAGMKCDGVVYQDSMLWMAIRLALVGAKPINAVVDLTNYVMFDIGHPMHVFDAQAFSKDELVVRLAVNGEAVQLLDGQSVTLTSQDVVVANDVRVVSLAGVMGGKDSAFQPTTRSIVLEAAGFDPAVIRKTAQRYKLRTEASMRFEKDLDPMQNILVLQRFLFLAQEMGVLTTTLRYPIVSVGKVVEPQSCTLSHSFLKARLGMDISVQFAQQVLQKLGFMVAYDVAGDQYIVTVPTHRATKDINITEDIVEEIIRSYGFENIKPELPMRQTVPFNMYVVQNVRNIKRILAYGLGMHELRDYMLYDVSWVSRLSVELVSAVRVKSPLSENWTTLVTSLVPHLLKGVEQNSAQKDHIRFFEYNRVWTKGLHGYVEQKMLSGIIFDKKTVNIYDCKSELQKLWDMLGIQVVYKKPQGSIPAWYDQFQVAELYVGDTAIGFMGMMSTLWMHHVVEGSAFIFELDGQYLENIKPAQQKFQAWSKFQDVAYDISLFVPLTLSSDSLCQAIKAAHPSIVRAEIVDFFEKQEWAAHRAITVRYTMSDPDKTMTKADLDAIVQAVHGALKGYHVQIR